MSFGFGIGFWLLLFICSKEKEKRQNDDNEVYTYSLVVGRWSFGCDLFRAGTDWAVLMMMLLVVSKAMRGYYKYKYCSFLI